MDDLKKFSQVVLNAVKGADTNPGSNDAAVNGFARAAFVDTLGKQTAGLANAAGEAATQEKEAADAARRAQIQRLQDQMDPGKYQKVRKEDGGFSFLDPNGRPITVQQYSKVQGTNAAYELKDSENPLDMQYVNDYGNTRNIVTAVQNGDTDAINEWRGTNGDIGRMTPDQIMKELIRKYPHIYGNGAYADSYKNINNPLLRRNTTGAAPTAAPGGSSGGSNYGFDM